MLGLGAWIFAAHMSDAARLTCRHRKRAVLGSGSENSGSRQRVPLGNLPAS